MAGHSFGAVHRHGLMACPACGYQVDASNVLVGVGSDDSVDRGLADGQGSICLACAAISVYVNGASALRPPTVEERGEFARDARVQVAVQALIEARDRAGSWPKGPKR